MAKKKNNEAAQGQKAVRAGDRLGRGGNALINVGTVGAGGYAAGKLLKGQGAAARLYAGKHIMEGNIGVPGFLRRWIVRRTPRVSKALVRGSEYLAKRYGKSASRLRAAKKVVSALEHYNVHKLAPKAIGLGIGATIGGIGLQMYGRTMMAGPKKKKNGARKTA